MKKKQVFAVSFALMIGITVALTGLPTPVIAQENTEVKAESIAIDEAHFPDKVFRNYVLERADFNDDNELSERECNAITGIFIDGMVGENANLISLKGLEYFPNITKLYCPRTNLSDIDITKNTKLKDVELYYTQIEELNVSNNLELEVLNISETLISNIDVRKNKNLIELHVQNTNITDLDVTQNTNLEALHCSDTGLKNLNIQNNTKLQDLSIYDTELQNINTSNNPLLETLLCHHISSLTNLDVSNNPKLKVLDCQSTGISNLDVSNNLELESLNCSDTQITQLDISNNPKLKYLYFYETDIAEIDTSNNLALEVINCHSSSIQVLDVSINSNLKRFYIWNVELLGLYFGNNPTLDTSFYSPSRKSIIVEGNTFNLLEQTNKNIDLSRVTITSNGTLDKNTGIVTVEDRTKDVIYEYDCGISQKGKETLEVILKLNSQNENTAPTISANDVTLKVGDTFDPLANVKAMDKEDGTITLTKDNVISNNVDTSKAGTYHVTYKVTDKNGTSTEKTITVTVKEKTTNKPVSPQQPQKPNKPTISTKPGGQKNPVRTGDITNVGLFASMFAGSTGALAVLFCKKRKRNKND